MWGSHFRRPFSTTASARATPRHHAMKLIDIAANLTDDVYRGVYNGREVHLPDLPTVLNRARECGVERIVVTGENLETSRQALALAQTDRFLYSTVGVHPTRCSEFEGRGTSHLSALMEIAQKGMEHHKVVAIGECGLGAAPSSFCDKETQKRHFAEQFWLTEQTHLPMFLHMRAAADDFIEILSQNQSRFYGGVVHSFTGSLEDLTRLSQFENLYFGVNGCSLKTEENLKAVAAIPVERLMIETDCPYCEIRNSHPSRRYVHPEHIFKAVDKKRYDSSTLVKGRNEPCNVRHVLDVAAAVKELDPEMLAAQLYDNTIRLFFPSEV